MAKAWNYPVFSADSHLEVDYTKEWLQFIPRKYQSRAPHTIRRDNGRDAWVIEGAPLAPGGLANVRPDYPKVGPKALTYEGTPSAGTATQRVQEQDTDGVCAEVLFSSTSSPRFFRNVKDDAAYKAIVRGYNSWLGLYYCAQYPDRLIGAGIIPWTGIDDAIAEMEFCKNNGVRTVVISRYPSGKSYPTLDDDKFYQAAADMKMPMMIHVSMDGGGDDSKLFEYAPAPKHPFWQGRGMVEECTNGKFCLAGGKHAIQMMFSGVFDRLPDFKLFLVENQIGWVPHFFEQADARYERHLPWSEALMDFGRLKNGRPSDYMREHVIWGFQENRFGVQNREILGGAKNLIWGSDFGHQESAYPDSLELLEEDFAGVPEEETYKMVLSNGVAFYHLEDLLPKWEARNEEKLSAKS